MVGLFRRLKFVNRDGVLIKIKRDKIAVKMSLFICNIKHQFLPLDKKVNICIKYQVTCKKRISSNTLLDYNHTKKDDNAVASLKKVYKKRASLTHHCAKIFPIPSELQWPGFLGMDRVTENVFATLQRDIPTLKRSLVSVHFCNSLYYNKEKKLPRFFLGLSLRKFFKLFRLVAI